MGYTLLIAEDERHTREDIVSSCDWMSIGIDHVISVQNGQEALDTIKLKTVHILLTDIVMPEIQGIELCAIVSRDYNGILSYLLTAYREFGYIKDAMCMGVQDYILKPVDSDELRAAMRKAVKLLEKRKGIQQRAEILEKALYAGDSENARELFHGFYEDAFSDWRLISMLDIKTENLHQAVCGAIEYIKKNLGDEKLSLNKIAEQHLFINSDYLGKLFKREVGVKFSTYLLNQRISFAQEYIRKHPKAMVYEIAEVSGFGSNPSYFSALFRKATGSSPTDYRG